jgi:hypothetical protein
MGRGDDGVCRTGHRDGLLSEIGVDFDPRLPSFDSEAEVARFMAAGATHFTAGGGRAAVPEMTAPRQPTFADGVVVVIDGLTPSARS